MTRIMRDRDTGKAVFDGRTNANYGTRGWSKADAEAAGFKIEPLPPGFRAGGTQIVTDTQRSTITDQSLLDGLESALVPLRNAIARLDDSVTKTERSASRAAKLFSELTKKKRRKTEEGVELDTILSDKDSAVVLEQKKCSPADEEEEDEEDEDDESDSEEREAYVTTPFQELFRAARETKWMQN